MIGRPCDNGRCGGGSAGPENRYHFPAVDAAKWDEATTGRYERSPLHGEAPAQVGAQVNTVQGTRGELMGASYGADAWRRGF